MFGLAAAVSLASAGPAVAQSATSTAPATKTAAAAATSASHKGALDKYCVTCHNARLKTANLSLEGIDVANVPAGAPVWEKVIRKMRSGAMPPSGRPRPEPQVYTSMVTWLEGELDRDAAAHPNPGRTESLHRLNRAEYQRAVRDLLALEIDVAGLLPADDMSYGFDNMAGVLKITPSLLERYLAAARQISRVAVGNPKLPPTAETFRLKADLYQDIAFDDLPIGTRGGTALQYNFPLDGEYVIAVEPLGGGADSHQLEVSIDGQQVKLFALGPRRGMGVGQGYDSAGDSLEVRTLVKAGPRTLAVTFVRKTSALVEGVREPFMVTHAEGDTRVQPGVASVTITGPYNPTQATTTPSRERIFTCRPANAAAEAGCARQIVSALARRAYRRPVTDAEVKTLLTFYQDGRDKDGFEAGIETAVRRLLVSPEFLFRVESDPASARPGTTYRLSDLELASRLSFFLWSSIPDEQLLDLAINGTLRQPGVLERQVKRMLADPRAEALATNFAGQWLYLRTIEGATPDVYLFPNFSENLRQDFRRETELFFQSLLRDNRSVLDLVRADFTFVNERLARHYGIPNVYGSHFRRVTIPDPNRRGLLGQGSILTVTSLADRTTVVGRGKWILENLLAAPPPQPPANVPPLQANDGKSAPKSLRERMEQHRANPVCATCHTRMDPLGFALENFDATGQWREREDGRVIDNSAVLGDGTKFAGPAGLRDMLLGQPEAIVTAVTEKLMLYALGRGLEYYDGPSIRRVVHEAAASQYGFQSLIVGIVKSTPFQMRRTEGGAVTSVASHEQAPKAVAGN
jgi:mono/diheme cytochrome c family protein